MLKLFVAIIKTGFPHSYNNFYSFFFSFAGNGGVVGCNSLIADSPGFQATLLVDFFVFKDGVA